MKIFKFSCPLHFANVEQFSDFVNEYFMKVSSTLTKVSVTKLDNHTESPNALPATTLVLDGGAISYVDSMGIEALQNTFLDGKKVHVQVLYADFSGKCSILNISILVSHFSVTYCQI